MIPWDPLLSHSQALACIDGLVQDCGISIANTKP